MVGNYIIPMKYTFLELMLLAAKIVFFNQKFTSKQREAVNWEFILVTCLSVAAVLNLDRNQN